MTQAPGIVSFLNRLQLPLLVAFILYIICEAPRGAVAGEPSSGSRPLFVEVSSSASGITWVHDNGASVEHYLPETMSGGVAFFDFNNDGWMDIYLVNSGKSTFFKPPKPLRNALYKNRGDGSFVDVTTHAGVEGGVFGMGAATADFDNDGYPDLLVTSTEGTILYHNQGDGTFKDITREAGADVPGWTTSAVWFDYDNDGWLDLFVCSFVEFGVDKHINCGMNLLGKSYYCVPRVFKPTASVLLRNNGNRTFSKVSAGTAIGQSMGKALGVVATDINNDGRMDLFVANDTVQDFLFVNRGKNTWEEMGIFAAVGFSAEGAVQSGMGVDSADFNSDGYQDLFVANIDHQYYSLFKNNGDESFDDLSPASPLGRSTFLLSGWGVKFFDFDLDGDLDLLVVNGHPDDMIDEYGGRVTYKEPLLLFRNDGGKFEDISQEAGAVFAKAFPSRGLAIGDFNNDGRKDAVVANIGEAPLLLRNNAGKKNHWLGIKLIGRQCNREAIGARISWAANGAEHSRFKSSGGSFLSSHDPRLIIGLGKTPQIDWVEVRWPEPSGRRERFGNLAVDRYTVLEEGQGTASPKDP